MTINTDTLLDISRHKDKIIKLSSFLLESDSPYLVNKMAEVDENDSAIEILLAFESDLNSTVKLLESLSIVLNGIDENDCNPELQNDINDLKILFPKHYENRELTALGVSLKSGRTFDRKQVKSHLFSSVLRSTDFTDYTKLIKLIKPMHKAEPPRLNEPFESRLIYANQIYRLGQNKDLVTKVLATADKYFEIRKLLSDEDKMFVDQKVFSGRSMIDGVTKASTFINKEKGVVQVSTKHKTKQEFIDKINETIKSLPFIKSVEIDQDSDPEKVYALILQCKEMTFEIDEPFELKIRKLGNYRASGIHFTKTESGFTANNELGYINQKLRIVACDVQSPTSLAHELGHYRDVTYDKMRSTVVDNFTSKMHFGELGGISAARLSYYLSDREVIARLAEVGYMLNQYDYKDGEALEDFRKRVATIKIDAPEGSTYHVEMAKSLDNYAYSHDLNNTIYFNMQSWSLDELSLCRDYTHSFFYKDDPAVQKRLAENIKHITIDTHGLTRAKRSIYASVSTGNRTESKDTARRLAWGFIDHDSIGELYKLCTEHGLLNKGEFTEHFVNDHTLLFKEKKSRTTDSNTVVRQYGAFSTLADTLISMDGTLDDIFYLEGLSRRVFERYSTGSEDKWQGTQTSLEENLLFGNTDPRVARPILYMHNRSAKGYKFRNSYSKASAIKSLTATNETLTEYIAQLSQSDDYKTTLKEALPSTKVLAVMNQVGQSETGVSPQYKKLLKKQSTLKVLNKLVDDSSYCEYSIESLLPEQQLNQPFLSPYFIANLVSKDRDTFHAVQSLKDDFLDNFPESVRNVSFAKEVLKEELDVIETYKGDLSIFSSEETSLKDALRELFESFEHNGTTFSQAPIVDRDHTYSSNSMDTSQVVSPVMMLIKLVSNIPDISKDVANKISIKLASDLVTTYHDVVYDHSKLGLREFSLIQARQKIGGLSKSSDGFHIGKKYIQDLLINTQEELMPIRLSDVGLSILSDTIAKQYVELAARKGVCTFGAYLIKKSESHKHEGTPALIGNGLSAERMFKDSALDATTSIMNAVRAQHAIMPEISIEEEVSHFECEQEYNKLNQAGGDFLKFVYDISPSLYDTLDQFVRNKSLSIEHSPAHTEQVKAVNKIEALWASIGTTLINNGLLDSPNDWKETFNLANIKEFKINTQTLKELVEIQKKMFIEMNEDIKPAAPEENLSKKNQMRMF